MVMFVLLLLPLGAAPAQSGGPAGTEAGSRACAACHAQIYRSYAATGMARSSGRTGAGGFRESFDHAAFADAATGAQFSVKPAGDSYVLALSRHGIFEERRALDWFVGSGSIGRSYVFSQDGFLFQSPVSYYSAAGKWDLSPGYERNRATDLTRAVEPACLQCHATGLQPVTGTQNRYRSPPFSEGGIGCERCHGPGKAHIERMSAGAKSESTAIVNPAKLDAARRDSVCAQCHLTGVARIVRAGSTPRAYRPGGLLSDHLAVFVWPDAASPGVSATSHYEKLAQSRCKQAARDKLWCGSCHDPHSQPQPAARVDYYRKRCLECHQTSSCKGGAQARRQTADDCADCHMPKARTQSVEHLVFTDHTIPRRAPAAAAPGKSERRLVSFWRTAVGQRDLALGYAAIAPVEPGVRRLALELLEKAAGAAPDDAAVLSQLAQFYDRTGQAEKAAVLYERVVRLDPANATAAVNLGTHLAQRGQAREAIALWQRALEANPALTGARVNLAVAQFRAGDRDAAEGSVREALRFDPDNDVARKLLVEIRAGGEPAKGTAP